MCFTGIVHIFVGLISMILGSSIVYSIFMMFVGIILIVTRKPRK